MQKKSSDKSPKRTGKIASLPESKTNIPYKKAEKRKRNPVLEAAAKKILERAEGSQKKKFLPKNTDTAKPVNKFHQKKKFTAKEEIKPDKVVYSADAKWTDDIRLNKYLSHAGIASRRGADTLIKEGRVQVNGQVVTEMGHKVSAKDKVVFDGKLLSLEKKYYVLLNKPKDFITTVNDERGRRTVMQLVSGAYAHIRDIQKPRFFPVGRLDRNTTGVLLITNDGALAQKLTHPSSEVRKVYQVILDRSLRKEDFNKIAEGGVVLEDGIAEVDEIAYPNPKNKAEIGIEIHTGKNRFIRRLFEALDYEVVRLDRVYFAGLTKKDLPRGRWRFLKEEEVRLLKHFKI